MSAESDYIRAEIQNLLQTTTLIENLVVKKKLTDYEVIALGKLLQDVYTGIERILRSQLETRNIKIKKTESWPGLLSGSVGISCITSHRL